MAAKQSAKNARSVAEGFIPQIDIEGSAYEAGIQLGYVWREALILAAERKPAGARPWWATRRRPFSTLISKYLPHLPDLNRGMAKGAGVPEERVGTSIPMPDAGGCTSFAVQPRATVAGRPISGQTKDTGEDRAYRFQVLCLRLTDAPSALTLTYPGQLFGQGLVSGGCSVFRNSLYAGDCEGVLPHAVFGLLALHCPTVEDVIKLARRHSPYHGAHYTIADECGGIAGLEVAKGGIGVLRPKRGIYVHANAVRSLKRLQKHESPPTGTFTRENSLHREERLRARLEADRGRLTPQLAYMALCDHHGYPSSVCRHQSRQAVTTSAVVVEPTRGLLHVCRGNPCQNWPRTYAL